MDATEIDLHAPKKAVNSILDHIIQDLGIDRVPIDQNEDYYWECPAHSSYQSDRPNDLDVGRLSGDLRFSQLIRTDDSGAVSYNLVHVAPLLRFIGEKIRR